MAKRSGRHLQLTMGVRYTSNQYFSSESSKKRDLRMLKKTYIRLLLPE
jgi:hypothetical protein